MDIQKEIDRRCDILKEFDKKMGVLVNFMNTPDKDYTYLSSNKIDEGLYLTHDVKFVYVKECSHEVLYNLDSKQLNIVRTHGKDIQDLELDTAREVLYDKHAMAVQDAIDRGQPAIGLEDLELMQRIVDNDYASYIALAVVGCSPVFDQYLKMDQQWVNALKHPFYMA